MRRGNSMYSIITKLFDEYPSLVFDYNRLFWCVWTKLWYTHGYNLSYRDFVSAPSVGTIGRVRRKVIEDHPLYKLKPNKHAQTRRSNS